MQLVTLLHNRGKQDHAGIMGGGESTGQINQDLALRGRRDPAPEALGGADGGGVELDGRKAWEVPGLDLVKVPRQVEGLTLEYGSPAQDEVPVGGVVFVSGLVKIEEVHAGRKRKGNWRHDLRATGSNNRELYQLLLSSLGPWLQ